MSKVRFVGEEFEIGDRIVVRDYDEMVEEYGKNKYGDITPNKYTIPFTTEMIHFCGESGTITDISVDDFYSDIEVVIDFDDKSLDDVMFTFTDFMIEKATTGDTLPDVSALYF